MHGFLWCQGSISRGKAKVSWEVVCLPKQEGGLGVCRLDHFNKALMVSRVWKLLSLKESLWVKWIHWCAASPLYNIISSSDIARAGFSRASKVRECIHDGVWSWPNEWLVKYPILNSIPAPILNDDKSDYFLVHHVWDSIRPRDNLVSWYDFVWFQACIPKHAFNMWLIFKKRLKKQDCLSSWDVTAGLAIVWSRVKHLAGLIGSGSSLDSIVSILLPFAKRKSSKSCNGKLVVAAAAYFVWQERNSRLFKNVKRSVKEVVDCIMSSVRLKLLSYHFKKSKDDTKENIIINLKLEYQTFRAKSTERLSQTYTHYKTLLNELANDDVNLSKHEINVDIYGRFVYEDNLIQRRYSDTKKAPITTPSSTAISSAFFYNNVIQNFQENSNDKVDERSSEEYLRDLDIEYQERALLANSKRFIKRRNNFSGQKANENTECYKCGNKGQFARDCFSKTSEPSCKSPVNNYSSASKGFQ
ncbi:hypothetical protein Tco_1358790, partial [Tanacetum coccineum]